MTGTTLHTVSRLLSGWDQRGLIASGRQRITLRDLHGLMKLADEAPPKADGPKRTGAKTDGSAP